MFWAYPPPYRPAAMPSELAEDPVLQDGPARGLHRNACTICRKRKMRCNRQLPCDTCVRLGFDCVYSSPRPPSGGSFARPPSGNHGQRAGTCFRRVKHSWSNMIHSREWRRFIRPQSAYVWISATSKSEEGSAFPRANSRIGT